MSKILTLKGRGNDSGMPTWHDYYLLANAIAAIVKGKTFMKASLWIKVAQKIEIAQSDPKLEFGKTSIAEEDNQKIRKRNLPDFDVKFTDKEVDLLWTELGKLKLENFGDGTVVPAIGMLATMIDDIAQQFGKSLYDKIDDEENTDQVDDQS